MAVRAYELIPISVAKFHGSSSSLVEIAVGILLILGAAIRISSFTWVEF
jgi:uncharacterized membrane protein YphA (DoxX/SURF4 family)